MFQYPKIYNKIDELKGLTKNPNYHLLLSCEVIKYISTQVLNDLDPGHADDEILDIFNILYLYVRKGIVS